MKTNLVDLKQVYKNYLEDNKPSSRESCPPPEKLVLFVRSKMAGRDQKKFLNHATKCSYCLHEVRSILDITKAENTFIFEMSRLRNSASLAKRPQARPLARPWSRNPVSVASAIVLLAAIAAYSIFHFSSRSDFRRGPTANIQLISPVEKAVSSAALRFSWEAVPKAKYYIIETLDATLDLIWRSESLTANEFQPSQDILRRFRPNESYFWIVTGVLENGDKIKSRLKKFSIRK
jgi:hypothetical protein